MKYFYGAIALTIMSAGIGFYFYPQLPATIPTHWNVAGEIDSYSTKEVGLSIMPIISIIMLALFFWIPKAEPKQENVKFNQPYYEKTIFFLMLFLFTLYCSTIAVSLGYNIDVGKFVVMGMGILFIIIGKQIEVIKQNWFFGIRSPWAIANEQIWNKTHKIGSKLFNAFGIVLLIFGFFYPAIAMPILVGFAIALAVWSFIYPYMEWKKIK